MRTITTITFISGNTEQTTFFVRPYSAKKPTYLGAARMVAAKLNYMNDSDGEYPMLTSSDISVSRIEHCDFQTN